MGITGPIGPEGRSVLGVALGRFTIDAVDLAALTRSGRRFRVLAHVAK